MFNCFRCGDRVQHPGPAHDCWVLKRLSEQEKLDPPENLTPPVERYGEVADVRR